MSQNELKTGSAREPLQLLYRNGEAGTSGHIAIPRFSDISLTKDSQHVCDDLIEEAKRYTKKIRSDKECQDCIALHSLVDELLKKLSGLITTDRQPFQKVLSQISAATEPVKTKLISISGELKERISEWRTLVLEGQRREQERLEREAEEKRNEAKYADNPAKRRQATVVAAQLEKEAKKVAPKAEKGIDTEEYWEGEITNRLLAAKLPEEIVRMDIDQQKLNQRIKVLQQAGEHVRPNMFAGIELTRKTRVRFHR